MSADNQVGITSTPVISLADNVIYLVAKTNTNQQLHALDLGTGADVTGSPSTIGAGPMSFDPRIHLNRPGLLLLNGVIYIGYGSHRDAGAYHGWVLGYDAKTLQLQSVYNSTPSGSQGAIWQAGTGLSTNGTDIWASVGNGSNNGNNTGYSVVRLTPNGGGLNIAARYQGPTDGDDDMQGGVAILGNTGQVVAGNKGGNIFLLGQSDSVAQAKSSSGRIGQPVRILEWIGRAPAVRLARGRKPARLPGGRRYFDAKGDELGAQARSPGRHVHGVVERRDARHRDPLGHAAVGRRRVARDRHRSTLRVRRVRHHEGFALEQQLDWRGTRSAITRNSAHPWSPTERSMSRPSRALCGSTVSSEGRRWSAKAEAQMSATPIRRALDATLPRASSAWAFSIALTVGVTLMGCNSTPRRRPAPVAAARQEAERGGARAAAPGALRVDWAASWRGGRGRPCWGRAARPATLARAAPHRTMVAWIEQQGAAAARRRTDCPATRRDAYFLNDGGPFGVPARAHQPASRRRYTTNPFPN